MGMSMCVRCTIAGSENTSAVCYRCCDSHMCAQNVSQATDFYCFVFCGPKGIAPAFSLAYDRQHEYLTYKLVFVNAFAIENKTQHITKSFTTIFGAFFCSMHRFVFCALKIMKIVIPKLKEKEHVTHTCALVHLTLFDLVPFAWAQHIVQSTMFWDANDRYGKQMKSENVNLLTISWNYLV